ncbi:hypothetical protein [Pseudoclavibacter helvolus]|uniref:Uncharacterized protein n=1 Tax=Pseudoclavibacter helvolus TaxID=255205 RepID=A0A7W4YES8_9MICO|nr:hypothetical protein [Pseudoclavibacter helvolus]
MMHTTSSATMTPTLTQIRPNWVTSSHPAFRSIESAASQPVARAFAEVVCFGSHCQMT